MAITPVSAWLDQYEEVELPSGRTVGLRQPDVLCLITADGNVPNLLRPMLTQQMGGKPAKLPTESEVTLEDLQALTEMLNRVARACFVEPAIVETMDDVRAGKGVMVDMIPYADKVALISYGMGGKRAIEAGIRFLKQQSQRLEFVPASENVTPSPVRITETA